MKISKIVKAVVLTLIIGSTAITAQNMQMPQIAPADSVTDSEIEQFLTIAQDIQEIRMEMDSVIIAKLGEEGMSTERFQEVMQSQQNPQAGEVTLTSREEETMATMQTFLQQVSVKAQKQQMESVQNSEMSTQRFQSIAQAMQTDKELAMRLQAMASEMESE